MIYLAIAEDHALVRQGMKCMLEKQGDFEVLIEAGNGKELIGALEGAPELPDICVIDINMPNMNGYNTLAYLQRKWPNIKTLAVSMYVNEYSVIRMIKNGASGYLPKDCQINDLVRALHEIHDFGYFFWDGVMPKLCCSLSEVNTRSKFTITANEQAYLTLCCEDYSNGEIAQKMNKSPRTVEDYRNSLFKKFQVSSRLGLALFALKTGLVTE